MVTCRTCQKQCTIDSRFCRSCGQELDSDLMAEARTQFDALLAGGRARLTDGRPEEAAMVAEEAILQDPSSVEAYTLLGDARERSGDLSGALDAYQRVVELHPDSPLDRIKLTHLRNLLSADLKAPSRSRRAVNPVALAAIATVAAASLGFGFMIMRPSQAIAADATKPSQPARVEWGAVDPGAGGTPRTATNPSATPVETPRTTTDPTPAPEIPTKPTDTPPRTTGTLPAAGGNGEVRPLSPGPIGDVRVTPERPTSAAASPDPDPTPTRTAGSVAQDSRPKPNRNSVVDIRPSESQPETVGGSDVVRTGTPAAAMRAAQQAFLAGDYAKAAELYETVLQRGGDPGIGNQRLAQCYDRLGRKSEAIQAYRRALEAFSSRSTAQAQSAAEACRQALKVLGG